MPEKIDVTLFDLFSGIMKINRTRCHRCPPFAASIIAWLVLVPVALSASVVDAASPAAHQAFDIANRLQPNPLLTVDQNRSTVVDRVTGEWGDALVDSGAGLSKEQLRTLLMQLRSDQLLAASLAGSLEGLRNVIANALTSQAPVAAGLMQSKALGDAADDLVYTPVTPCREVDTRNAGGAIGANSSRDFKVWVSSGGFTAQGGSGNNCGIPPNPAAVVVNLAMVSPAGAGNLIAHPTGTPTLSSVLNYQSGQQALSNGAIVPVCATNCVNQLTLATNGAGADVVMDIVGYFKAPAGAFNAQQLDGLPSNRFVQYDASGNVGIGIASAGNTLDVNGQALFRTGGSGGGLFSIHSPNSETGITINGNGTNRADIRFDGGRLKMLASFAGIPPVTNGVTVTTSGRVGVGTDTPQTKLDVAGDMHVAGSTILGGNVSFGAGISNNSAPGLKHVRTSGTLVPNSVTYPQVYWGLPFPDANYTLSVTVESVQSAGFCHGESVSNKTAGSVFVSVRNDGQVPCTYVIHMIGIHD